MKKIMATAVCICTVASAFAQTKNPAAHKGAPMHKPVRPSVEGTIRDAHYHPVRGVEAFIYQKDSTIIASGYTDSMGHYETNAVMPGTYNVKIVYPGAKDMMVTGVVIKAGPTQLNVKGAAPAADTSVAFTTLMPQPEKKKVEKKKAN